MHTGFWSSLEKGNIFVHGWKRWTNPWKKIDRGHHRRIRMDGIYFFTIYAGIGKIRLIRQKAILSDGLEFHIEQEVPLVTSFQLKKEEITERTDVQHVTQDEAGNPETQQSIRNYHMTLESAIFADEFMSDDDVIDAYIN